MSIHHIDIYHCQHCGKVTNCEHEDGVPNCCGDQMARAVANLVYDDACQTQRQLEKTGRNETPPTRKSQ